MGGGRDSQGQCSETIVTDDHGRKREMRRRMKQVNLPTSESSGTLGALQFFFAWAFAPWEATGSVFSAARRTLPSCTSVRGLGRAMALVFSLRHAF